jgi:sugar phosphate isomerase/epimerase
MRMLDSGHLVVTGSSLGHPPFEALVEAAAAGGFDGLSLWPHTSYQSARAAGLSDADMRRILEDHGVVVNDVDALVCPLDPGSVPAEGADFAGEAAMFDAGEALGASYFNVVMTSSGPIDVDQAAEVFAGVSDRARERGLIAYLEFVPFMAVPDAKTAWEVVRRAGREHSGVMVDSWHCFRGPTTEADLRAIPGERVLGVQINDAPEEPMEDALIETLHHRLVPGEGAIDLVSLLGWLHECKSPAPICVEVFSDALLEQGTPAEIAVRLGDAIRRSLEKARSS